MLRQLSSSDSRFKSVTFKPGLNLIIADTTGKSRATDSRNGAGKSSLIEILHFLLGARADRGFVLNRDELRRAVFRLELDWPSSPTGMLEIQRSIARANEVSLDHDVRRTRQGDSPLLLSLSPWQQIIERDLFGLTGEHPGVSGRALLALYLRRASAHAFNDPIKAASPQQSLPEATTNLAYLLGLDWQLASRYRDLSERENTRRRLASAAADPVWGKIVGRSGELRGQITVAQQRTAELEQQIAEFQIVPGYEELQATADELNQRIRQSRADDTIDRRNLQDLEKAIEDAVDPDISYLERVYQDLGITLAGSVQRSFDEVERFHASIIANRRLYLADEIATIRARLAAREAERQRLGDELAHVLKTLDNGGALVVLTALQQALAQEKASLEALRNRFEAAQLLEASAVEIKAERSRLESEVRADLNERGNILDAISLRFLDYATRLYGSNRTAYLEITPTASHLKIVPHIDSIASRGISNMVLFCFDLTVAVTAHRAGRGPDFLVHDSHLFDGVDGRQMAGALTLAREVAAAEGIQYIVTMNSDDLAKAQDEGFGSSGDVIAPRLTDQLEDGGLFGFSF